jgi:Zn-dependent protease with chaperone function
MVRYLLALALLAAWSASAQQPQAPQNQPSQPAAQAQPEAKVESFSLPPDKLAKAIEYSRAKNWIYFVGFGYSVLVLITVLNWRLARKFGDWATAESRRRIVQAFIFIPLLSLAIDLLGLPVSIYQQHLLLRYEQSIQGWGSWAWDWTKSELIGFVILSLLAWILYAVIRRSPRRWWFYFWLASIPIILFLQFIAPVLIDPLFNKFEPLEARNPQLVASIGKVVRRGGLEIPPDRMFEMKASEKYKSVNAYVTGLGASKRVVVWDTTIRRMTPDQTLFVFGHEMGHYVLGHIWIAIGLISLGVLASLFAGYHALRWMLRRWGERWAIRGVADWESLPALLLVLTVLSFAAEPLGNWISRVQEHHADIYGLEVIHGIVPDAPQAAAQAFQILGEISLSDPHPSRFIEFWRYDHPSVADRVAFAASYNPWAAGRAPRYVK